MKYLFFTCVVFLKINSYAGEKMVIENPKFSLTLNNLHSTLVNIIYYQYLPVIDPPTIVPCMYIKEKASIAPGAQLNIDIYKHAQRRPVITLKTSGFCPISELNIPEAGILQICKKEESSNKIKIIQNGKIIGTFRPIKNSSEEESCATQ